MFSLLYALYNVFASLSGIINVSGYASLIISIWFFSGLIIFILGIVGLYIGKTFEEMLESSRHDKWFNSDEAKEFGLRTLLVHFDNSWNSELAVKNVEQICKYTGFDLHTYVVNWEEFKDLQKAYIKSGVLDWEVPTDHGLWAVILKKAVLRS